MLLRNTKKIEIENAIKKSGYFTIDDFDINFNSKNDYLVMITFAYPCFTFIILENEVKQNIKSSYLALKSEYKTKNVIQTRECPGDFKENETKNYDDIDSCIYRIDKWIKNLYDDIRNINLHQEKNNNHTKDIKEELDKHFNDTERFSHEEIDKLNSLLDDLNDRVRELEEKKEISNNEASNLMNIVQNSKNNLRLMPKKTWFIATWNKFKNIDANIKTALGFKDTLFNLIEYANKLLN
ncbi:hypothetical protein [Sulfurimonas sp.]